jgi:hypothetical protein
VRGDRIVVRARRIDRRNADQPLQGSDEVGSMTIDVSGGKHEALGGSDAGFDRKGDAFARANTPERCEFAMVKTIGCLMPGRTIFLTPIFLTT